MIAKNTKVARDLLNQGVAFGYRSPDKATECFKQAKALASDVQTKNTARLYLGAVFQYQYIPNMCREEKAANDAWLKLAAAEFNEVLRNAPSDRDRGYAEQNIKLIQQLRGKPCLA